MKKLGMTASEMIKLYNECGSFKECAKRVGWSIGTWAANWVDEGCEDLLDKNESCQTYSNEPELYSDNYTKVENMRVWTDGNIYGDFYNCPSDVNPCIVAKKDLVNKKYDNVNKNDDVEYQIAVISDTHFGSTYQQLSCLNRFIDICKERGIDTLLNAGDIIEGLSARMGHKNERFLHAIDDIEEYCAEVYPSGFKNNYFICLSSDTEVYTSSGWKKYDELNINDEVLSFVEGNIVFNHIRDIQVLNYKGKMISIKNKKIDILVTPDHMSYLSKTRNGPMKYVPSVYLLDDKKYNKSYIKMAGNIIRKDADISDSMIALCALVVTEGTYAKNGAIQIYQYDDTSDPIRKILNESGVKWSEMSGHNSRERVFYIYKESSDVIKTYIPIKLDINWFINNLSHRQMNILHEWMMFGDGHVNDGNNSGIYYTSNENLANQFQLLSIFVGYRSRCKNRVRDIFGYKDKNNYEVSFVRNNYSMILGSHVSCVEYDGIVFDITTDVGNFLIKRNGTACFTGNCGNHCATLGRRMDGYDIGKNLVKDRKDLTYLPENPSLPNVVVVDGGARIQLFHGMSGCAKTRTGRTMNKSIEMRAMGQEFDIFIGGHCHSSSYIPNYMNKVLIGMPSFQAMTPYLANKGLVSECGGLILSYQVDENKHPFNLVTEFIFDKQLGGIKRDDY